MPRIERLQGHHNVKSFSCEEFVLDDFLRRNATGGPYDIWVMVDESGSSEILSFYAADPNPQTLLTEGSSLHHGPAVDTIWLRYLATDKRYQGRGYATDLLFHLIEQVVEAAEVQPIELLVLDALNERAYNFYIRRDMGFKPWGENSMRLLLGILEMRKLVNSED